jgi:DNA-binding beta-propeller fold protein YncE
MRLLTAACKRHIVALMRICLLTLVLAAPAFSEVKSGPFLPHKLVANWAQLPKGWNFGECSGIDVDKEDNVWVFNRGKRAVMQFDKAGKLLQSWDETPIKSSHGIRVGPDGNIWTVDVAAHTLFTFTPQGRILQVIGSPGGRAGTMESKDSFNRPTGVAFGPGGEFYVSDGYENSRVVKFGRDGVFQKQWGKSGTGDSEFRIVHDVAVDSKGRVYVADRENHRVQVFDSEGSLLTKWTDIGSPWGLYYVARENAIYMCDGYNNRIVKLNTEGQITGVLGSYGKTPGKFDFAHNIAVDSTGAIYVAEIKNWRVQKFAK